jgi:acyl-CoA thioester hydrolase
MHAPSVEPCAEQFPHRIVETLRFAGTDRNGHITSSVFAICCQSGRLALLSDPARALPPLTSQFVLARLTLEYRREMHWPGTVEIGTRVERIGRSSIVLAQALFHGNRCVATAQSIAVLMSTMTRRAQPIPQEFVESLQGFAGQDHVAGAGLALRQVPILVHTRAANAPASALHPPDDA